MEDSSIIPKEYSHVYKHIPDAQKQSFVHSFEISDAEVHPYERLADALERTLEVYQEPDPYLYFLLSRVSFVCTKYNALEKYYNKADEGRKKYISPFYGRVKTFQNDYPAAIELAKSCLNVLNIEDDPKLIDILLYFEANFTLGLSYAYKRDFDNANKVISALEAASGKFMYKKLIGEDHMLDYVFFENILKSYVMFFSGNPKDMADVLSNMREWTHKINDPWLEGFYYNMYGISRMMFQELAEGERSMRVAFKKFEVVHDLRGYSTVGANLGLSLIEKGKRKEGREYLEAVINPLVSMKNFWLAVGNMLELAKSYLEEKEEEKALEILNKAELISSENNISDPNIFSMFSYFYAKTGEEEKSLEYVDKLRTVKEESKDDKYTDLYYYMASSVTLMHQGNLQQANIDIKRGIEIADSSNYYNYVLELSMVYLEITLKRYLIEQKDEYILKGLEIVNDLNPLISMTESPFYETLFYILSAYLNLATNNRSGANENYDQAELISEDSEETFQFGELILFKERLNFLTRARPQQDMQNKLFDEFVDNWMSEEFLKLFYVLEAKRLLQNLQFEKTNLDQKTDDVGVPNLLFIVGSGGITIYTHRFSEDTSLDEVLVGGFLSALTTFSQELFGGGMLTRIDQENHVLLMERISEENILVMIVEQETYTLRKNFKRFSTELAKMKVIEYLSPDQTLSQFDPQYQILEGIVEIVFGNEDAEIFTTVQSEKAEEINELKEELDPEVIEEKVADSKEESMPSTIGDNKESEDHSDDFKSDQSVDRPKEESFQQIEDRIIKDDNSSPEEDNSELVEKEKSSENESNEEYVPSFMKYENEE